jgi:ankyrin repeat protein
MDELGRTDIFYSIVDGDETKFQQYLIETEDVNVSDKNEMTLLHFCSEYNRISMAKSLIEKGAELNLMDSHGNSPLWKAVFNARGNYELVQVLVDAGANTNSKNNADKSPLDFAKTIKDDQLIELLQNE